MLGAAEGWCARAVVSPPDLAREEEDVEAAEAEVSYDRLCMLNRSGVGRGIVTLILFEIERALVSGKGSRRRAVATLSSDPAAGGDICCGAGAVRAGVFATTDVKGRGLSPFVEFGFACLNSFFLPLPAKVIFLPACTVWEGKAGTSVKEKVGLSCTGRCFSAFLCGISQLLFLSRTGSGFVGPLWIEPPNFSDFRFSCVEEDCRRPLVGDPVTDDSASPALTPSILSTRFLCLERRSWSGSGLLSTRFRSGLWGKLVDWWAPTLPASPASPPTTRLTKPAPLTCAEDTCAEVGSFAEVSIPACNGFGAVPDDAIWTFCTVTLFLLGFGTTMVTQLPPAVSDGATS